MIDDTMDTQLVELVGRNWLIQELLQAGLEVALPARDRGIDLIAYADLWPRVKTFAACPIQMKASSGKHFGIYKKYLKFPNLIIAHVWYVRDRSQTTTFALTHHESVQIGTKMRWTKTKSWKDDDSYTTRAPSARLRDLLEPFRMTPGKWWLKVVGLLRRST
jgi:hypothetical protein